MLFEDESEKFILLGLEDFGGEYWRRIYKDWRNVGCIETFPVDSCMWVNEKNLIQLFTSAECLFSLSLGSSMSIRYISDFLQEVFSFWNWKVPSRLNKGCLMMMGFLIFWVELGVCMHLQRRFPFLFPWDVHVTPCYSK